MIDPAARARTCDRTRKRLNYEYINSLGGGQDRTHRIEQQGAAQSISQTTLPTHDTTAKMKLLLAPTAAMLLLLAAATVDARD